LVRGNHDHESTGWFRQQGFALVVDRFVMHKVLFTHAPVESLPSDCAYNLFGHVHNLPVAAVLQRDHFTCQPWHRALSLEMMDYTPQLLNTILYPRRQYIDRRDLHGEPEGRLLRPAPEFSLTLAQYQEHLACGGTCCPRCHSTSVICALGYTNPDGTYREQGNCQHCGFQWRDNYRLEASISLGLSVASRYIISFLSSSSPSSSRPCLSDGNCGRSPRWYPGQPLRFSCC
jgi:transposase-like protein